jgi:NADPH2:quinone reductase
MRTVYIKEFGGPEQLEIREIAEPSPPESGEILVRVAYAGLNRADLLQRRGLYPPPAGFDPHRPGLEFSGTVEQVGENVAGLSVGDKVCGITAGEAQSDLLTIDQRLVAAADLSLQDLGAVPEVFVTAHDALYTQANLREGETVLIHAAASGVGLAAAQIAKAARATVIGTTRSSEKAEQLLSGDRYGNWFDHVLVTNEGPNFASNVIELSGGADVTLDLVGGDYFPENLKSAAQKGRIILVGLTAGRKAEFDLGAALSTRLTIRGTVLRSRSIDEKAAAMEAFRREIVPQLGKAFRPVIDKCFPVENVREAHEFLESNATIGKVLLEMDRSG